MDDFLTPVSTTVKRPKESIPEQVQNLVITSPEDALEVLKNKPDLKAVGNALNYLAVESYKKDGFHLVNPAPLSTLIAHTLVTVILPDFWRILKKTNEHRKQFVRLFSNPNGLGAIMNRLRPLIDDCRQKKSVGNMRDSSSHIEDIIEVLDAVLVGDRTSIEIWNDIQGHVKNSIQSKLIWKEYVAQVASGRVLSIVAEAEDALKGKGISRTECWLASGSQYAFWLGQNIAVFMKDDNSVEASLLAATEMGGKALFLGYTGLYFFIQLSSFLTSA